ncbi:putative phosphatase [Escherichia coli]|uniref:Putative phosphatase n=1 Tax=Escherichia coli TaxID=562 RepID=A0A377AHX8_ECOLX|nr:putative phosphatase [Escherichia coli]
MYERYAGLILIWMAQSWIRSLRTVKRGREVLGHYGLQYDIQAMIALNGSPTWRIAQAIIELNQADLDPHALAREKTEAVRSMLLDSVEPLPLVDVVKSWHGRRPMAVGTGSESAIAEALLAHLGLRHYFDAVVAADHVKHHKPAPDTFLLCAQRMGVQPTQCVVLKMPIRYSGGPCSRHGRRGCSLAVSEALSLFSLFASSFLSATLLPGNSEVVLVANVAFRDQSSLGFSFNSNNG